MADSSRPAATFRELRSVGLRFWYSGLVATSMIYTDQLLLNLFGSSQASAEFFLYSTIFLPPMAFAGGFLTNSYNPYLRQCGDDIRNRWRLLACGTAFIVVATALVSLAVGLAVASMLGRFGEEPRWWIVTALVALGSLRTIYIAPSGIAGVFGERRHLDRVAAGGLFALATMIVTYLALVLSGLDPVTAIAISLLANASIRLANASAVALDVIRTQRPLTISFEAPSAAP